jgi:hypothetical protein
MVQLFASVELIAVLPDLAIVMNLKTIGPHDPHPQTVRSFWTINGNISYIARSMAYVKLIESGNIIAIITGYAFVKHIAP